MKEYGQVIEDALIADYTTYKLAGKIRNIVIPENEEKLINLLSYLKENNEKYMVIGNGSNLIFTCDYDGVVIKLDNFNKVDIKKGIVTVGAGYNLIKLAMKTAREGLSGLEFATGIPATIGGAIYMNAGAYLHEMSEVVKEVKIIDDNLEVKTLSKEEMKFAYRKSILKEKKYICLSATLELTKGNKEKMLKTIRSRKEKRQKTQPLEYPSAGSVFQNPEGDFAGRLIEEAGLKGKKVNDAEVSKKHANFIINKGNANGEDVKYLMLFVKQKVWEKFGVELVSEQEFIE